MTSSTLLIGKTAAKTPVELRFGMANRHGLIAGATGTGKTVTLERLAEGFSKAGVPVFLADIKGDLAGLSQAGSINPRIEERMKQLELTYAPQAVPTLFWDVLGVSGHHLRMTIDTMGPLLLARALELNDTQTGVLEVAFAVARREKLPLIDLKDLRSLLMFIDENEKTLEREFGNMSSQSIATIQRSLLRLQEGGGDKLFGEPQLSIQHFLQRDFSGQGVVSILDGRMLFSRPRIYSALLVWLLSTLFEQLPEIGDPQLPTLIFFFDEAHLLFEDAPRPLLERIEQIVRLIRSKGVGIYFVTQHPNDIPDEILGQLGNRVQHALRAFTPKDQKAVRAAAATFRQNPGIDTEEAIQQLAVGEGLVSVLDERGSPTAVERALIAPPSTRVGPVTDEERKAVIGRSPIKQFYDPAPDRESAAEMLEKRKTDAAAQASAQQVTPAATPPPRPSNRQTTGEAFAKSVARSVGNQIGRQATRVSGSIIRNLARQFLASLFRKR